jgi:hypothetical protein
MLKLAVTLFVAAVLGAPTSNAQTAAPPPAVKTTVKALQPGLFEVAGPRVMEVAAGGVRKITAVPGSGVRAISVESQWGTSYFGWPKGVKPVAFTIETGKGGATATISAPGFKEANKADYRAAIEAIVPFAISRTQDNRNWMLGSGR